MFGRSKFHQSIALECRLDRLSLWYNGRNRKKGWEEKRELIYREGNTLLNAQSFRISGQQKWEDQWITCTSGGSTGYLLVFPFLLTCYALPYGHGGSML